MVEASDSSHSGIVVDGTGRRPRVGLEGAEAAKSGCRKDCNAPAESMAQSGFRLVPREVGEERGGVTGALLEIRSGGREEGTEARLQRNGRM